MKKVYASALNQKGSPCGEAGIITHIVLIIILAVGLIAGLYLVQHPQIFRPKAGGGSPIIPALEMRDSNGENINCDTSANPPVCETSTQDITIKIKDLDILQK